MVDGVDGLTCGKFDVGIRWPCIPESLRWDPQVVSTLSWEFQAQEMRFLDKFRDETLMFFKSHPTSTLLN